MLRLFLAGIVAPGLIFAVTPVSYLSQGLGLTPWGFALPGGEVLRKALHSCQFVRYSGREHTLCPQRLRYRDFPKHLADALVASEDRSFFAHKGIDKQSVLHAALINIARSLREQRVVIRRGGSTITQQLARTLFLDPRARFSRKLGELALAPRIEAMLSKQEILATYMNVVPHARGMNGFDDAARYFFGVPVGKIDISEAALLVGMLPAPNDRDPVRRPEPAYDAAVRVLERMAEQGMITAAAARRAEQSLRARILGRQLKRGRFVRRDEEMRPYRDLAVAEARRYGVADDDDYRLITHMDIALQDRIVDATRRIAGRYQAAGVFIRPTGEVLGIAGSRNYAESSFNRAFQSSQPIGSTGKLFVLIAAHENAIDLNRRFAEKPLRDGGWPAEPNRQCDHAMTLAQAFAESCNRPFARAAAELEGRLTRVVSRFELEPPDAPVLVPLGGIETSPLMLTRAYASVVNDGNLPPVRALAAALGGSGGVVYAPSPYPQRVMSRATAASLMRTLRAPVHHGTARLAASKHAVVYGKTGTSSDNQDALFVGMTRDLVGTFWIGDDNNRSMRGVSGAGAPARAFAQVTASYYTAKPRGEGAVDANVSGLMGNWMGNWRLPFDVLQNREHRYYALSGFAALTIGTFWLQTRRSALGWLIRSMFGMRVLAVIIGALWRWFRRRRASRKRQPKPQPKPQANARSRSAAQLPPNKPQPSPPQASTTLRVQTKPVRPKLRLVPPPPPSPPPRPPRSPQGPRFR